jgi:hypothetical protein
MGREIMNWATTLSRQINVPSTAAMAASFNMIIPVSNADRVSGHS